MGKVLIGCSGASKPDYIFPWDADALFSCTVVRIRMRGWNGEWGLNCFARLYFFAIPSYSLIANYVPCFGPC